MCIVINYKSKTMKKKLIKTGLLIAFFALGIIGFSKDFGKDDASLITLLENVEALANDSESSNTGVVIGKCADELNDCLTSCPHCNTLYYSDGKRGPASNVRGTCTKCKGKF